MNVHSIVVLCAASVTFSVGIYHFMYSSRLRSWSVDMAFAAACFSAGFYDLASSFLYASANIETGMIWQRWQFILLCGMGAAFLWFVSEFTGRKSRRLDRLLMGYLAIQALILTIDRSELTLTAEASIKKFIFLGAFPIAYHEVTPGILCVVQGLVGLFSCGYILYSLVVFSKKGNKLEARPIITGIAILTLAVLSDIFVGWGFYNCIYVIELSFLVVIICMGCSLNEMHLRTQIELQNTTEGLRKLEAAVKAAAESIVVTDPKGVIEYVNPAFEEMTGYTSSEVIGKNSGVVKSGKHDEEMYKDLWASISAGRVWRGHFTNRKKDGSLFQEDAVISPIRNGDGDIVNFVAVKRDITQEALLENQLRQSQKMEALGQLASGVAHDFTNMLAVIMGHTQLLKSKVSSSEDCIAHIDAISESTNRLSSLTGDLLAFAHQKPVSLRLTDLNRVVKGMKAMLDRTIENGVELQIKASGDKLVTELDPDHIEQAIMYLVVNAIDVMPGGGVLTIETSKINLTTKEAVQCQEGMREEDVVSGDFAVVSITDTGCGMPEKVRARVFEPFFTTKGKGRTTGLGLSTAYGIISQHNGSMTVYSAPGHGTTFRIYLPLAEQCEIVDQAPDLDKSKLEGNEILIAEDDYIVRNVLVHVLQNMGFSVLEAEDGFQAIRLFEENKDRIALLITDVMMPEKGGCQLVADLRKIKPDLRVIFASGYPESHLRQTGIIADGETIINKPLSKQAVVGAIEEAMKK